MKKGKALKIGKYFNQLSIIGIIIALMIIFTIMNPLFFTGDNMMNIVRQASVNIIMAMGVTFVMVSGNIDLSIGGTASLTGMAVALMLSKGMNMYVASLIGICIGLLVGFLNGYISGRWNLPAMIVTLAMMNITNGIASLLTGGTAIYNLPDQFSVFGRGFTFGVIPNQVVIMIVVVVISWFVLSKCVFGRYAFAIGGNPTVTKLSGVNVFRYSIGYFMISGGLSSLAAIILISRMMTGQPNIAANSMMNIMTAVVIGGAMGSGGGVFGSFLGALLLTVITNGLTCNGINSYWQLIITAVILLAVIIVRKLKK